MACELFVYWRVAAADGAAAEAAGLHFQSELRERHPALIARLFRRIEASGAPTTLMETYALQAGIDEALQAEILSTADAALGAWCIDRRHPEVFELIER